MYKRQLSPPVSPLREAALRGENAALHARGDALEAQLGDSWRQLSESRVSSRQEAAALEERVGRLAAEVRQATQTQRLLEQANVQLATELRHRGPLNGALKGAAVSASTSPQPPRSPRNSPAPRAAPSPSPLAGAACLLYTSPSPRD